jgi:hypothetical protein
MEHDSNYFAAVNIVVEQQRQTAAGNRLIVRGKLGRDRLIVLDAELFRLIILLFPLYRWWFK